MTQKSYGPEGASGKAMAAKDEERDELFAGGVEAAGSFVFDERVAQVFPDMISRSVPGYALVVAMTGLLARRYARPHTRLYDLGCSLGATTLAICSAVTAPGVRIVAVDNSPAMVRHCRERLDAAGDGLPVEVVEADIRDVPVDDASFVALNFTLQFVDPAERLPLLARIRAGLCEGGALVLSEKICFEDQAEQIDQTDWHLDFKRAKGYSELEIAGKRAALENVLRPDTEAQLTTRLAQSGFRSVRRWFQCLGFCSYVAFR
jgi:tRNA (cmo5U34)-methyltransferase